MPGIQATTATLPGRSSGTGPAGSGRVTVKEKDPVSSSVGATSQATVTQCLEANFTAQAEGFGPVAGPPSTGAGGSPAGDGGGVDPSGAEEGA